MAKLIIMQGLPASGKSTKAAEILKQGNTVRINKDLLRTMLHFDKWTGKNEGLTKDASRALATHFLLSGMNVIVDDTNLNEGVVQGWVDLAKLTGSKIEYVKMETPLWECMERDMKREKSVGGMVIKNMALQSGLMDKPKKGYILCDIDGTIAEISHRLHFVKDKEKKDWKSFFSGIPNDAIREDTHKMLKDYFDQGYEIIFVTARPEDYKRETEAWLNRNVQVLFTTLIMRRSNDKRPDTEVKKDMLDRYFKDKSLIHKVIDDRPSVIRMWREQGLDVIDVGSGKEF